MTVIQTYHTMLEKIRQIIPTGHAYRTRNLAWLITGIMTSQSVHTSKIGNKIPGQAKRASRTRRLERFLNNSKVKVRQWYHPVATALLEAAHQTGEIRLMIDATKVTANHQLLMVALAYRRRALPVAWTWVRHNRGHSTQEKQEALLGYVYRLVPEDATVILTGDSEFASLPTLLEEWGWFYVLRQKGRYLYRQKSTSQWQRLDTVVGNSGSSRWLSDITLTKQNQHSCHFLAHWHRGEKEPWLLATNFPNARQAKRHYKVRPWIEEMFGDFKSNGADLEKSRLQHFLRLSRLTLAVALFYVWMVAFGSAVIKRGDRHLVDRSDRRDLSIYRIGYDMFERCLINDLPITIRDVPYFY